VHAERPAVEIDDVVETAEALVRIHDRLDVLDHDAEAEPPKPFADRSAITVEHHLAEQPEHDPVGALKHHMLGHAGRCLRPAELAVERRHPLKVATCERHRADPARDSHALSLILAVKQRSSLHDASNAPQALPQSRMTETLRIRSRTVRRGCFRRDGEAVAR
jgi:hypothetical protein